ncbi:swib mdm2 domain-containing protein [Cyclospora cayetanensis]|uniref:Swib mdm2 domain-containing protein n=1 Tax=Cyclospora cayetanensis TaxID=88456 RepID=A0A1D3DA49_9EIME|nr:swib mdm2 domain-containing protein [Cyclospora cayetanensis]
MGKSQASRVEVTKFIWAYIKEKDLQKKENRRIVVADERLMPLLRQREMSMFELNKRRKVQQPPLHERPRGPTGSSSTYDSVKRFELPARAPFGLSHLPPAGVRQALVLAVVAECNAICVAPCEVPKICSHGGALGSGREGAVLEHQPSHPLALTSVELRQLPAH